MNLPTDPDELGASLGESATALAGCGHGPGVLGHVATHSTTSPRTRRPRPCDASMATAGRVRLAAAPAGAMLSTSA